MKNMKKGFIAVGTSALGFVVGGILAHRNSSKEIEFNRKKIDKFKSYYQMLNEWMSLKQQGRNLEEYFQKKQYYEIAIYGMGEMGKRLIDELEESNIHIDFAIDNNPKGIYKNIPIKSVEEANFTEVDAVIVAATFAFEEIDQELQLVTDKTILTLDDVVYSM